MGRPPLPDSQRRTEVLQLRLTKDERSTMDAGADAAGEIVSEFIRNAALDRAREALIRARKRKTRG